MAAPNLRDELYPTPAILARRRLSGALLGPIGRWWHWLGTDTRNYSHPHFSHGEAVAMVFFGAVVLCGILLAIISIGAGIQWLYERGQLWVPLLGLAICVIGASLLRKIMD